MTVRPVTVNLPSELYDRLKQRAEETHRTVEAELLDVVSSAIAPTDELPSDLADALSALTLLNDADLWRAARSHLPDEVGSALEALHLKRQREGLTEDEASTLAMLVRQYERFMLVRAQAASLLKQRGHDVASLVPGT